MTNKEAIWIINNRLNIDYCTDEDIKALDLAIKALHTVDIINEELNPADEDKAVWFDIPHWEEIQERADMRGEED